MHYVLLVLAVLSGLLGMLLYLVARTSIHEIQAGVFFIVAAVLLAGGAVVQAIHRLRKEVAAQKPPAAG